MLPSNREADLEAFQRRMAVILAELIDGEGFLSLVWIQRLLQAFLQCQEDFWDHAVRRLEEGWLQERAERLLVEYHQRMLTALDVCNATSDGIHQVRRWGRLASIAASVLLAPGKIHEGQLRRARKALSYLSVLLVDNAATAGAVAGIASHRNHSFRPAPHAPSDTSKSSVSSYFASSVSSYSASSVSSTHFKSVPRTWSAARQLQAIGSGLAAPLVHEVGLPAPVYAMVCVLHLVSWVLVAAIPYLDRGAALQADHLPPLRAAFPWAPPLLALQVCLTEEGKRKDRLNSRGLLKEIHALEKCTQRLAEAIDSAPILLAGEREATVREAAAELAAVCAAMKNGLEPLERQVREVYHHIAHYHMEGLDLLRLNAH